jgi:hypothetical protein
MIWIPSEEPPTKDWYLMIQPALKKTAAAER